MAIRKLFAFGELLEIIHEARAHGKTVIESRIGLFRNKSLSVECLCCHITDCKAVGRFYTKTRIRVIFIRTLKK